MDDYRKRRLDVQHGEKNKKITNSDCYERAVYYYILAKSVWNLAHNEDHYYIRKKDINKTEMSRKLGMARSTVYKCLDSLKAKGKIIEDGDYFVVPWPHPYAVMRQEVLEYLLGYVEFFSSDIIWILAILKGINPVARKQGFNASELVYMLEHCPDRMSRTKVRSMLLLLEEDGFIKMRKTWTTNNKGLSYYVYHFDEINIETLPIHIDKDEPIDKERIDKILKEMEREEDEDIA